MLPLSYVLFTWMPMPPLAENSWLPELDGVASVSSAHLIQEARNKPKVYSCAHYWCA